MVATRGAPEVAMALDTAEQELRLLAAEPLEVVTHVGRDVLANAAHFATVPKAVHEYVSNSIDATPPGRACTVRVDIAASGPQRRITISDDASGMSRELLRAFFTMHGENVQRRAGRKVRGRFGTGKIAAFGRADRLRVDTIQRGLRNVVELTKADLETALAGRPIRVRELATDEPTVETDGTRVSIEGLHRGTRVDRAEIIRYLQRQLGRHLVQHRVHVEGERVAYAPPDALEEHRFASPENVTGLAKCPLELVIRIAARPLAAEENGIAVLCNGFLNAMTLAGCEGKPEAQYLFGELEAAVLDDDTSPVPAFLATRDLTLNPWHPIVAELLPWVRASIETVRRELVRRAGDRRRAVEQQELEQLGDDISTLLNAIYRGERVRLVKDAPAAVAPRTEDPAPEQPLTPPATPRARRRDRGTARGPRPLPVPPEPPPVAAAAPALGSGPYGTFQVLFRHAGEASPRAFYRPEERGIVMNLDHPEAIASLQNGGPNSPFFAHYCYRTAMEEFTLAMVADLGYPDAPEIAREIRERSDKYSRQFAPAILRLALGADEGEVTPAD